MIAIRPISYLLKTLTLLRNPALQIYLLSLLQGVILKEDTLELPEEEITSPQKIDVKVTVTVLAISNSNQTILLKVRIVK